MFYANWGLNFNNGMFAMMNPYSMFGFNPYMMRFNMMQSLLGSIFNNSRSCNCQHNNQVQYIQQPVKQFVQPFNYSTVQPSFDNSHFENYMARMNNALANKINNIFEQNYESSFNAFEAGQHLYKVDLTSSNSNNIFAAEKKPLSKEIKPNKNTKTTASAKPKAKAEKSKPTIQIGNKQIASIVHEKAQKYGVDENLILAIISQESGFINGRTSIKGAKGLMQLMPATARELGVTDVNNPEQNIDAGVRYMKQLLDMYGGDVKKALAAYNGGMGNVNDILNGTNKCGNNPNHIKDSSGIPRMKETQNYVSKIYKNYKNGTLS